MEFKKVLILGAGTMGHQIGFLCATKGLDVAVYDISEESLAFAQDRAAKLGRRFVRMGKLTQEEAEAALNRMSFTSDAAAAAEGADIVNESVPEVPKLKGKVFAQFNELCPENVIFTTNTSTLMPSAFAEATGRPEKFAALHFHDVSFNNVVDIMPHPGTAPETIEAVKAFSDQMELVSIVLKKESPGYVFNALLTEWLRAAQSLAARGVAEPQDVDRAWMGVMGVHTGPFAIMDSIGLDTCHHITEYWSTYDDDPRLKENAAFLKTYVDKGELGAKTGKGFYNYPGPEFTKPDFIKKDK
ncbi:3-Hydroxybutyryl-CoA dehydrogenase (NAD-binding) [Desulfatibacillum aliphaticivorans]|uniref:3-Hydroxybutyryl-CoA dehydrogenase (NAD-binding) n=1 Tax=Desulfatibacillum aliphaticivorans TaxID=218208 RepID=B8FBN4_DESAL|nr:3-hydroxyacyl-CoA dehydrogenase [Desulfatibacillum aliphaticivorans]ACL04787.1 3-Hydroxybutyryl-CoA dehydrogenase (NAD-binding) [Desulfatibacillum aliphaticivorans]